MMIAVNSNARRIIAHTPYSGNAQSGIPATTVKLRAVMTAAAAPAGPGKSHWYRSFR
jgi:hypothetical protein